MDHKFVLFVYSGDFGVNRCEYVTFESWESLQDYLYSQDQTWSQSGDNTRFYYNQSGLYCYPIELSPDGSAFHLVRLTPHAFFNLQKSKGINLTVLKQTKFIEGVYSYSLVIHAE